MNKYVVSPSFRHKKDDIDPFAIVFPGQGSQYAKMGIRLYQEFSLAKKLFDAASQVVGYDLLSLQPNKQELYHTLYAQPAIFSLSVISYQVFKEHFDYLPHFFAGHSLGEYSALVCSGALDFFEGMKLVQSRARLMAGNLTEGQARMCAIENASLQQVNEVISQFENVYVSSINSVKQIILSGLAQPVEEAAKKLENFGAQIRLLELNLPFHTPLLKEMALSFGTELKNTHFNLPNIPVISNVTARPYESVDEIKELLAIQVVSLVNWQKTMEFLVQQGCNRVIEIGPKRTLVRFFNDSFPSVKCQAVESHFNELSPSWFLSEPVNHISNQAPKALKIVATTKNKNGFQEQEYFRIQTLNAQLKKLNELNNCRLDNLNAILSEILALKGFSPVEIDEYLIQDDQKITQIFCFPYAGGSANLFKEWNQLLPSSIEIVPIEYPGRGSLSQLPLAQKLDQLLEVIEDQVKPRLSHRFVFFGHSLGAILAYEMAQRLKNKYNLSPLFVCLSACPAPHRIRGFSSQDAANDHDFIEKVKQLNGTSNLIFENEVLREFFLPVLRADFHILDHYQVNKQDPLPSPFILFGGDEDQFVSQDDIQEWQVFSHHPTTLYKLQGDHFFIRQPNEMLKLITIEIEKYAKQS